MCLIGRELGMIQMRLEDFPIDISEASAAIEFKDTWQTGSIHDSMTIIISQFVASIINLEELINKLK